MRGPIMSGAVGSPETLRRLRQMAGERPPTVVLSTLWLASALAGEIPVAVFIEPDKRPAARRAVRRAARTNRRLLVVAAGEALPVRPASLGSILVENLLDIEADTLAADFLRSLTPMLRPGGLLVSVDASKRRASEARLAALFLMAALTEIGQQRPRDGAVITNGVVARIPVDPAPSKGGETAG